MDLISYLEEKRNVEVKNRSKLNKLERDFYKKVFEGIKKLENERAILYKQGDFNGVAKKTWEINRAKKFFSEIINMRIKKILTSIMWRKKLENMTPEEEAFYDQIKNSVNMFINALLEGEGDKNKAEIEKEDIEKENYVLVRVVVPIFKLALPERDLVLRKEDVLYLPDKFFRILAGKGIVKEIKLKSE